MAETEKPRKPYSPRKNPHHNKPHQGNAGVNKAMHNFGVRDLREWLDKKHQEQGDSPGEKVESRGHNPPPDPSYNFLKDPSRDRAKPTQQKRNETDKPQERHVPKDRSRSTQIYRAKGYREQDIPPSVDNKKDVPIVKNDQKDQKKQEEAGHPLKKELRFSDKPKIIGPTQQFSRGGKHSFRGKKESHDKTKEPKDEKIENPINIKIALSTATGERSYVLDSSTLLADIKHVPDRDEKIVHNKNIKSNTRGRGGFRGRGRGNYRGRGGYSRGNFNRGHQGHGEKQDNIKDNQDPWEESNTETQNVLEAAGSQIKSENDHLTEEGNQNVSFDRESEEFNDSNDQFEEFSSEYYEELPKDSQGDQYKEAEHESPPESERYDSNLTETITITSSKFQDGETTRSVEVKPSTSQQETNATLKDEE